MRGRYTPYSPELAAEICARLAEGQTPTALADMPGMPGKKTMYNWRRDRPEFRAAFDAACASRAQRFIRRFSDGTARRGHPPVITPEVTGEIMRRIAEGESLADLAQDRSLPAPQTILNRIRADAEFRRQYQVSCEEREALLIEEATLIADFGADVTRDRIRVELRKWRVAQLRLKSNAARDSDAPDESRLTYAQRLALLD